MTATSDERSRVLQMLEEGKINAEEATTLLRAMGQAKRAGSGAPSFGGEGRYLRVHVTDTTTDFEEQHLLLSVHDDGQGFEAPDLPDALAHQGHFGLMGIQERALLYGGQLTIRSAPGKGTEISVQLPYPS